MMLNQNTLSYILTYFSEKCNRFSVFHTALWKIIKTVVTKEMKVRMSRTILLLRFRNHKAFVLLRFRSKTKTADLLIASQNLSADKP